MDTSKTASLLDRLDDEIDDLEEAFEPLTSKSILQNASKMPVLDKAKLYVLSTYAIESMLFSYLRLNGVNAKEHPVFKELTRVRQYFDKLKAAENIGSKPEMKLDKEAATRFIKAGLSGNDKYDKERAEREAKERAIREIRERAAAKRKADSQEAEQQEEDSDESEAESESPSADATPSLAPVRNDKQSKSHKKRKESHQTTASESTKAHDSKKSKTKSKSKSKSKGEKKSSKHKSN